MISMCCAFFASTLFGQSIDRQVISSYGNLTATTSATVGEVMTETKTVNGVFTINQGFQQTNKDLGTGIRNTAIELTYSMYPNPTADVLNVALSSTSATRLKAYISNALGQEVSIRTTILIDGSWDNSWTISSYPSGAYFLNLEDESGQKFQSLQFVIK